MLIRFLRIALVATMVVVVHLPTVNGQAWRVLPIRSQAEFDAGYPGGEAEQHLHSMGRCLTQPDHIYISQDICGLWRSADAGETWQKTLDHGLYLNNGQSMAVDPIDPDRVFLEVDNTYNYRSTAAEGLYRSEDGGTNWIRVLATSTHYNRSLGRVYRQAIACDLASVTENHAMRWYAAFPNNGIFRSDDGGLTFSDNPLSSLVGHDVIYGVYPHTEDEQTVYVATEDGLYVSRERGTDLQAIGNLPTGAVTSVAIDGRNPSRVFATVKGIGLYLSEDGGMEFSLQKAFDVSRLFMNPGFPDTLFLIGMRRNTIVSHDGGKSWFEDTVSIAHPETGARSTGAAMELDGELAGLAPNPQDPNEAVGYAKASLWKTVDGGKVFSDSSNLFTGYAWTWWNSGAAFDRHDPNRFAFFNNDVGMVLTENAGDYFVRRNPNAWWWYQDGQIEWIGTYAGDFQPVPGSQRIVASIGDYFRSQLMTTGSAGASWDLLVDPSNLGASLDRHLFVAFHPNDPEFVYAGDKVSVDGGVSFEHVDFGPFSDGNPYFVGLCRTEPDTVFAIAEDGKTILRSRDRGATWSDYAPLTWRIRPFDSIPTFAADPVDPNVLYTIDERGDLARFDGESWASLGVLDLVEGGTSEEGYYNFVRTVTVDPRHPEILYVGMFSSGIDSAWRSVDSGETWETISENLPRVGLSTLAVSPHTGELFVGTGVGTWIHPPPYESENTTWEKGTGRSGITPPPLPGTRPVYQAWRLNQFGFRGFLETAISGPLVDFDHDGFSNLAEYAMFRDPTDPHEAGSWLSWTDLDGGLPNLYIQFPWRSDNVDLSYSVIGATDLESWSLVSESVSSPILSFTTTDGVRWKQVQVLLEDETPTYFALEVEYTTR